MATKCPKKYPAQNEMMGTHHFRLTSQANRGKTEKKKRKDKTFSEFSNIWSKRTQLPGETEGRESQLKSHSHGQPMLSDPALKKKI